MFNKFKESFKLWWKRYICDVVPPEYDEFF